MTSGSRRRLFRYAEDVSGAAAVEFALWLTVIAYPMLNVVDVGAYAYQRLQVENAAQMAVQGAFNVCSQAYPSPVFTTCNTKTSNAGTAAVTNGAQSTSLGTNVTVSDTSEYVDGTKQSGTLTSPPSNSGDYLGVKVTATYTPIFRVATVTSLMSSSITRTHWMRMS